MNKIFVASFHRASDGAISKLVMKLKENDMLASNSGDAGYVLAVGDRTETFDFVLNEFRKGKSIIHLWAGEISQGTEDEVYRHSITLMSMLQLCTHNNAKFCVEELCKSVGKISHAFVIGNVMMDNLKIDESCVPEFPFNLVLYNPPTLLDSDDIKKEIHSVDLVSSRYNIERIWVEPNGDKYSELLDGFALHKTFPRSKFLGLLKHCNCFITNSSCAYYEAPFLMDRKNIVLVGERNRNRNSQYGMNLLFASDNIIKVLKEELS